MSVFTWAEADGDKAKDAVSSSLKRGLREIESIPVLPAEEGTVAATKRSRKLGLKETEKALGKYERQALRPAYKEDPVVLGAADRSATVAEDLTTAVTARNALDVKLEQVLMAAASTKEGARRGISAEGMVGTEALSAARKAQLHREARSILMREYQRAKRIKKIKSTKFRKYMRASLEKQRVKTLERLEEEDPEAAQKLREEYEAKRAEMRLDKSHRSRRRWAQMAARFGGQQTRRMVAEQFEKERENKELLDKLSGRKSFAKDGSDDESDSDTSDESDDEDNADEGKTKEERLAEFVDKTAGALADAIDMPVDENDRISKNIRGMTFMKRGEQKKKAELAQEAEAFLELLEKGYSESQATKLAKDRLRDDFEKEANDLDLPDVEARSIERAKKKREMLEKKAKKGLQKDESNAEQEADSGSGVVLSNPNIQAESDENSKHRSILLLDKKSEKRQKKKVIIMDHKEAAAVDPSLVISAPKVRDQNDDDSDTARVVGREAVEDAENEDLVRMAFALTDTNLDEFHSKREAEWNAEKEKAALEANLSAQALEGWGSWTGEGIRKKPQKVAPVTGAPPLAKSSAIYRLDQQSTDAFTPCAVPYYLTNKKQLNAVMSQPIGREWVPEAAFLKLIEPKVKVRAGTVIAPMTYQGPRSMRKGIGEKV